MLCRITSILAPLLLCFPLFGKPSVVVTTTLISTAIQDVSGDAFEIETLMPAGTCPGQFDLAPTQASIVARASLVVRHDMQGFLDRLFTASGAKQENIIAPHGSFTIPGTYLAYCEKIAAELSKRNPGLKSQIDAHLAQLRTRMASLSTEIRTNSVPLAGTRVVAARFQADLLLWLGLEIVATFPPAEDPSPAVLKSAIETGRTEKAVLVVGNIQNGSRVPNTIAETLGLRCVMLGNFPVNAGPGAQENLIRQNLKLLLTWKATAPSRP